MFRLIMNPKGRVSETTTSLCRWMKGWASTQCSRFTIDSNLLCCFPQTSASTCCFSTARTLALHHLTVRATFKRLARKRTHDFTIPNKPPCSQNKDLSDRNFCLPYFEMNCFPFLLFRDFAKTSWYI